MAPSSLADYSRVKLIWFALCSGVWKYYKDEIMRIFVLFCFQCILTTVFLPSTLPSPTTPPPFSPRCTALPFPFRTEHGSQGYQLSTVCAFLKLSTWLLGSMLHKCLERTLCFSYQRTAQHNIFAANLDFSYVLTKKLRKGLIKKEANTNVPSWKCCNTGIETFHMGIRSISCINTIATDFLNNKINESLQTSLLEDK